MRSTPDGSNPHLRQLQGPRGLGAREQERLMWAGPEGGSGFTAGHTGRAEAIGLGDTPRGPRFT